MLFVVLKGTLHFMSFELFSFDVVWTVLSLIVCICDHTLESLTTWQSFLYLFGCDNPYSGLVKLLH